MDLARTQKLNFSCQNLDLATYTLICDSRLSKKSTAKIKSSEPNKSTSNKNTQQTQQQELGKNPRIHNKI